MAKKSNSRKKTLTARPIESLIHVIRGQKVMVDADLATLYAVQTGALNQAVRRNMERFPEDFAFRLSKTEFENWKSQSVISNPSARMGLRRAHGMCDVFVTLDRNLEFQQNIKVLSFGVVVVRSRSNRIKDLSPHISDILHAAIEVRPGQVMTVGA